MVYGNNSIQLVGIMNWLFRLLPINCIFLQEAFSIQICTDCSRELESVLFILSEVITDATFFAMEISTAQFFLSDTLTCGRLH